MTSSAACNRNSSWAFSKPLKPLGRASPSPHKPASTTVRTPHRERIVSPRIWPEMDSPACRRGSLCDLETIEQRDLGEIHDEGEDHCRQEYFSHNGYRQRSHGDSARRQGCGDTWHN